jgi:hypothetical protein
MRDWTKDGHTLAYVLRRHWKGGAFAVIVSLLFSVAGEPYIILHHHRIDIPAVWEEPTVEINIQLDGCPDVFEYRFYGPCRPGSALHAMNQWNEIGSNFRFVALEGV